MKMKQRCCMREVQSGENVSIDDLQKGKDGVANHPINRVGWKVQRPTGLLTHNYNTKDSNCSWKLEQPCTSPSTCA